MAMIRKGGLQLKTEFDYFDSIKEDLLKKAKGQFALIRGRKLVGTYTKAEEAYEAGVERFGVTPFLIREILSGETIESVPAITYGLLNASL